MLWLKKKYDVEEHYGQIIDDKITWKTIRYTMKFKNDDDFKAWRFNRYKELKNSGFFGVEWIASEFLTNFYYKSYTY